MCSHRVKDSFSLENNLNGTKKLRIEVIEEVTCNWKVAIAFWWTHSGIWKIEVERNKLNFSAVWLHGLGYKQWDRTYTIATIFID